MTTSSSPVSVPRVASVGYGYWGKNIARNLHALGALALVVDDSPAALADAAQKLPGAACSSRFLDALEDPTIVAVALATPAESHARMARQALEAGKDVFVEKPLCLDPREGAELVELARKHKRVLMVGHLLWYHPAVLKLKALIDEGALGKVQFISSTRLNLGRIRHEENILWSFAPHDISVILGLIGEEPTEVSSSGGAFLQQGVADVTVSVLSFPSGKKAHTFVSWLHPIKEQKLVVIGDKQMAVFDDGATVNKLVLYPHTITWRNQHPVVERAEGQPVPLDNGEPLRAELDHFLTCVRDRATPRTDGAEGLRVLKVLARCQAALAINPLTAATLPPPAPPPAVPALAPHVNAKIHASAFIDDGVIIGDGSTIWHVSHLLSGTRVGKNCRIGQNVVIGPRVTVGDGVKIQNNVSVYEGVTLEDDVFCGPSMVFTNVDNPRSEIPRMDELRTTLVRRGATLGANCTVVCGTTIGRYAFVGAGAVVTHDVSDYALMLGVPARRVGWTCRCATRLPETAPALSCSACGRRYELTGDHLVPLDPAER